MTLWNGVTIRTWTVAPGHAGHFPRPSPVPTKLLSRLSLYRVTLEIALDNTQDYTTGLAALLAEDYTLNLRYLIRYFTYFKLTVSSFLSITNINSDNIIAIIIAAIYS